MTITHVLRHREAPSFYFSEAIRGPTIGVHPHVPGFLNVDVKYLPKLADESSRRYLFVAIDRATRWVYLGVRSSKSGTAARYFLKRLLERAPFYVTQVLTDNGKEFTDRFVVTGERHPTGRHPFDRLCAEHGIQHRLTKPRRPQTNGMVERFNGRIADLLRTSRFNSGEQLQDTLRNYLYLYNHSIQQQALGHRTAVVPRGLATNTPLPLSKTGL